MNNISEDDNEASGDPARAFEDLRAEVSVMRRAVEALPGAWKDNQPPNYSPDLGRLFKGLIAVDARLDALTRHPTLAMTPEQHAQAIAQVGRGVMGEATQKLDRAAQAAERERQQLVNLIGTARLQYEQRKVIQWTGGIAFVAALLLGLVLSPYAARLLFWGSWQTGVAATVMGADRWNAGGVLMQAGDADTWDEIANIRRLGRLNQKELAKCRTAAYQLNEEQWCTIVVPAR